MRDHPAAVLTRHFFASLFDFGFLSEEGAESLKRALLGCLAVALAIGLLLTRVYMKKYGALSDGTVEAYTRETMADHAFLIAVQMWFVAGAVALVGHSLFPDRNDFRILMAAPLSRLTIFAAKLAALLLFVGLIAAGTGLALLPLAALTMIGAMKSGALLATAMAFGVSSLIATAFAALSVVATHGVLVVFALHARALGISSAVKSVLIGGLVITLPLIARLPGTARAFAANAWWLTWAPPAWFAGLEQWLAGNRTHGALAAEAAIAAVLVFVVSIASYVLLYRRFDRVMLQPPSPASAVAWNRSLRRWIGRAPVRHAIRRFVAITVRRSALHQGLVVGMLAAAAGFVLNGLLSVDGWSEPPGARDRSFLLTILWAPVTMMFIAIPAIRVALSVPLDLRSNWVFRMTEDAAGRAEVSTADVLIVLTRGVAVPLALLGPLQYWAVGPAAAGIIALEALIGWLLVEWVMADWNRIPFTCSYIPGKGFVPHMVVKAFASYIVFTTAATLLLRLAYARTLALFVLALLAGGAAAALAFYRTWHAPATPLLFDDELPTDVNPLRLNSD